MWLRGVESQNPESHNVPNIGNVLRFVTSGNMEYHTKSNGGGLPYAYL